MADKLDFQLLSLGMRRMGWIRFWIQTVLGVVVVGVFVSAVIGTKTTKRRKKKIKRSEYYSPQQFLYRRRIKKARRWARYGTQSWLREQWRKAKYNIKGGY